jgi:DNA-binding FadR family transcriptional regulator
VNSSTSSRTLQPEGSVSPDKAFGSEVRVPKAAELVAAQLRREIVSGKLAEGDALPTESALMEQFGVSRPTLREAFRVLEAEALITVSRGARGGARVQVPKTEVAARYAGLVLRLRGATLADVLETRAIVEPPLAARLARKRTNADLAQLRAALAEGEEAVDDDAKRAAHHHFHQVVIELAGNQTAQVLMDILDDIVNRATEARLRRGGSAEATHLGTRSHRRLVELIEARDADGAERVWRKHIVETTKYLTEDGAASTVMDVLD